MGSSSWSYFVSYQPSIDNALQELRQKIFEAGDYYKPAEWYKRLHERKIIDDREFDERLNEAEAEPKPKTIEELLELRGHTGTHSILDIKGVSLDRHYDVVVPLTPQEYLDIFGTDKPEHEIVEQKDDELQLLHGDMDGGVYVVVYQTGLPSEIYFTGFSGD